MENDQRLPSILEHIGVFRYKLIYSPPHITTRLLCDNPEDQISYHQFTNAFFPISDNIVVVIVRNINKFVSPIMYYIFI